MAGTVAYGLHEGSRSEYLAQYAFASWGTAVAIPHHEDHGVDLSCTLMERVGRRYLARSPYTVQVKSTFDPVVFGSQDEVRWLIEHPLPLYLCVVDKSSARLSVYHTFPRFYTWALGQLSGRIELVPEPASEKPGRCTQWSKDTYEFSLGQPILDFTVNQMLDNEFWARARRVFEQWVCMENDNLTRIRAGLLRFWMPEEYATNDEQVRCWVGQGVTRAEEEHIAQARAHLVECLEWFGGQLRQQGDVQGMARVALLHRHLFGGSAPAGFTHVHMDLNQRLIPGGGNYVYAGVDHLAALVDAALDGGTQ